jgi:hypothetical protein
MPLLALLALWCRILHSCRLVAASDLSSSSLQLDLWHRPPVGQCHVHLVARSHIQPVAQCHLHLGTMPPPIRGAVPNSTSDIADLWRTVTLNLWRNRQRSTWLAYAGTPVACSQGASTPVAATPAGSTPIQLGDIADL